MVKHPADVQAMVVAMLTLDATGFAGIARSVRGAYCSAAIWSDQSIGRSARASRRAERSKA
jgi:hypothetical protein